MDRRERLQDLDTTFLSALRGHQAGLWTAMPGVVKAFDPSKMTVSVQPTIKARVRNEDGSSAWVQIPMLVDCPVIYPGGGGFTLTFPIQDGDECLVVFASRCIDSWWQSGGVQIPAEMRMHDLSDGFAFVGPRSQPRKLDPVVVSDGAELRNEDRTAYIKIDAANNVWLKTDGNASVDADGDVYVTAGADIIASAGGDASVTATNITLTGNVTINGNLVVTGTVVNDGKNIGKTHTHSGVTIGGGNTGVPV